MKESTRAKWGFYLAIAGIVLTLLSSAVSVLAWLNIRPEDVGEAVYAWFYISLPFLMMLFGFFFGFSVRHLAAWRSARKAQAAHDEALAAVESERNEAVAKAEAERDAAIAECDAATRRTVAAEVERDEALVKAEADRDAEVAKAEAERDEAAAARDAAVARMKALQDKVDKLEAAAEKERAGARAEEEERRERMISDFRHASPWMKDRITQMFDEGSVEMREDDFRYYGVDKWADYTTLRTEFPSCHTIVRATLYDDVAKMLDENEYLLTERDE